MLDGMEEHGLGSDSRAEGHGATELARAGMPHQLLEDEDHRGRRHIPVIEENVARVTEHGWREL